MRLALFLFFIALAFRYILFPPSDIVSEHPTLYKFDGYYFAREAEEVAEGKWSRIDSLRDFPHSVDRKVPNLISVIYGVVSKVTGFSVIHIDFAIQHLLASLFILSGALFLRFSGYTFEGAVGTFLASISPIYLYRTLPGSFDTDSLNLFFPFLMALFGYTVLKNTGTYILKFCASLGFYILTAFTYFLWYKKVELIFASMLGLFIAFVLTHWRKRVHTAVLAIFLGTTMLFMLSILDLNMFAYLKSRFITQFLGQNVPQIHTAPTDIIVETKISSLAQAHSLVAPSEPMLIAGLLGFILFSIRNARLVLLLLPVVTVALAFLVSGKIRFLMYIAPIYGIGLAFLIRLLFDAFMKMNSQKLRSILIATKWCIVFMSVPIFSYTYKPTPIVSSEFAQKLRLLETYVEPGGGILSWWDYGYAIQYYSRRATFMDGGNFRYIKDVANAFLSQNDDKLFKFVERTLGSSPKPVYVLITADMINKIQAMSHFTQVKADGVFLFKGMKKPCSYSIDLHLGTVTLECNGNFKGFLIKEILYVEAGKLKKRSLGRDEGFIVVYMNDEKNSVAVLSDRALDTLVVQLFLFPNRDRHRLKLIANEFPYLVLYRVDF